ncbi:hypothetical protein [Thauera sp. SDU_THAU2]|uniref:hypothetical protein n=1 Tax=Thauera sp. SDU_THAU2 TaxID=3136633 RepID=UPI00311FCC18
MKASGKGNSSPERQDILKALQEAIADELGVKRRLGECVVGPRDGRPEQDDGSAIEEARPVGKP